MYSLYPNLEIISSFMPVLTMVLVPFIQIAIQISKLVDSMFKKPHPPG